MFYHALTKFFDDGRYDFIKLTYYLDKHYMSPKSTVDNSIFLFLVPCKNGSIDFVIIVVMAVDGVVGTRCIGRQSHGRVVHHRG